MQSYRKNKIKKQLLAMVVAASLFVTPSVVYGQNIAKTDAAKANTITVNGNVIAIMPDRFVNGDKTAINQFAHFDLDKGNIANLHLDKANTLVNFVDTKANINGIVNAVKDNQLAAIFTF